MKKIFIILILLLTTMVYADHVAKQYNGLYQLRLSSIDKGENIHKVEGDFKIRFDYGRVVLLRDNIPSKEYRVDKTGNVRIDGNHYYKITFYSSDEEWFLGRIDNKAIIVYVLVNGYENFRWIILKQ